MGNLSLAGDGDKDLSINKEGTDPGDLGGSGGNSEISFAGDGAKDVWNTTAAPKNAGTSIPGSGEVEFAGDGSKDA